MQQCFVYIICECLEIKIKIISRALIYHYYLKKSKYNSKLRMLIRHEFIFTSFNALRTKR